jgi:hypothetical protein
MSAAEPSTEELRLPTRELRIPSGEPGLIEAADRLAALEDAVREHRRATDNPAVPRRPSDHALYRLLDQRRYS